MFDSSDLDGLKAALENLKLNDPLAYEKVMTDAGWQRADGNMPTEPAMPPPVPAGDWLARNIANLSKALCKAAGKSGLWSGSAIEGAGTPAQIRATGQEAGARVVEKSAPRAKNDFWKGVI